MCVKEETAVVGGPRDCGFREESPLRLAGFITAQASHGKPTHRHKYRHTWTHMSLVLWGLSWEVLIISSHTALEIFHPIFFILSPFSHRRSRALLYIFFSHSHLNFISLSHSPRLSLGRPPFRQKGVCQVPNPWAKRSKADKETGDLLFYSGKAKNGIPHRPGHCILPLFSPSSSFPHSILLSGFSLFFPFVSLSPAPSQSLLSLN